MTSVDAETYLAVLDLLARYGHMVDDMDVDAIDQVFTPDAVFDATAVGGKKYVGLDELRAWFSLSPDEHPLGHFTTNSVIWQEDGRLRARSKFYVLRYSARAQSGDWQGPSIGLPRGGVYEDVLEKVDGAWLIAERRPRFVRRGDHFRAEQR